MSIALDDRALDALSAAKALPLEHFDNVCKLAVAVFLAEKQSRKRLTRAASACGWEPRQLERSVLGIAKVLMDVAQLFVAHKKTIHDAVSRETVLTVPRYRNMEWRIDLEIATRFLRNQPKPIVTLRFDTLSAPRGSGLPSEASTCVRVDYEGLRLLQRRLEQALQEVDSVHCNRIQRYMH